jgi:pimeloyl-ACP methyl ester carboxylesterase
MTPQSPAQPVPVELPRLVLFPGLGADERLLHPQRQPSANLEVPPWIEPRRGERLSGYAQRIAATIRSPRPFFVGGVSLGGMVALEVARHVDPCAVLLISSCRSCRDLPPWARAARVLVRVLPAAVQKWSSVHVPATLRALGACDPGDRKLVRDMIRDTPAGFLKWALSEALRWNGVGELDVPIFRIHGSRDRTIPCPRDGCDEIIPGGGHLINLTHAGQVNAFIASRIARGRL